MPEFHHTDVLPLGPDDTEYRRLDLSPGRTIEAAGRTFLEIDPATITALVHEAVHDIQHLLRPAHLAQLRRIIDDPEASANDRFVATDLLRNACVAAGGVLPMCQDTGTAIVVGKRTETVLTGGQAAVPSERSFSSRKPASRFGFSSALVSWYRNVLLAEPPPLARTRSSYFGVAPGALYSSTCAGRFVPVFRSSQNEVGAICE